MLEFIKKYLQYRKNQSVISLRKKNNFALLTSCERFVLYKGTIHCECSDTVYYLHELTIMYTFGGEKITKDGKRIGYICLRCGCFTKNNTLEDPQHIVEFIKEYAAVRQEDVLMALEQERQVLAAKQIDIESKILQIQNEINNDCKQLPYRT